MISSMTSAPIIFTESSELPPFRKATTLKGAGAKQEEIRSAIDDLSKRILSPLATKHQVKQAKQEKKRLCRLLSSVSDGSSKVNSRSESEKSSNLVITIEPKSPRVEITTFSNKAAYASEEKTVVFLNVAQESLESTLVEAPSETIPASEAAHATETAATATATAESVGGYFSGIAKWMPWG